MSLLLAIDEGTSSARAIVFSLEGRILGLGRRSVPLHYPQPGWVEQDPEALWQAQVEAVEEALRTASVQPTDIAAVGLTNQRETIMLGTPTPVNPTDPLSYGKTAAPLTFALRLPLRPTGSDKKPASCPTPTSPPLKSTGCCAREPCPPPRDLAP